MSETRGRKHIEGKFTELDPRIEMVPESGCWVWMGSVNPKGYGRATDGTGRHLQAHRAVWESLRGPIPRGLQLDHLCRVRSCVNPEHLRVVTLAQNVTENSESPTARNKSKNGCGRNHGPFDLSGPRGRQCSVCLEEYKVRYNLDRQRKRAERGARPLRKLRKVSYD